MSFFFCWLHGENRWRQKKTPNLCLQYKDCFPRVQQLARGYRLRQGYMLMKLSPHTIHTHTYMNKHIREQTQTFCALFNFKPTSQLWINPLVSGVICTCREKMRLFFLGLSCRLSWKHTHIIYFTGRDQLRQSQYRPWRGEVLRSHILMIKWLEPRYQH